MGWWLVCDEMLSFSGSSMDLIIFTVYTIYMWYICKNDLAFSINIEDMIVKLTK